MTERENSQSNHFAPVILNSEDAKAVHDALLASGYSALAQNIRLKANRSRLDKMYAEHVVCVSDDEFDHDDEPVISQGASGAYVMVWRWVYKDEIRQTLRENRDAKVASFESSLAS